MLLVHGRGELNTQLRDNRKLRLGKKSYPAECFLGAQWGSTYRIERGKLVLQAASAGVELEADSQVYGESSGAALLVQRTIGFDRPFSALL